jgi:hypothetical protein
MSPASEPARNLGIFEGAALVDVDPAQLRPTLEDIALHAGGEGFALTDEMRATVLALLPMVVGRVSPRFAYTAQRAARFADHGLVLMNGIELPVGRSTVGAELSGLVAAVCTMGPEADHLRTELGLEHLLDAWLLDALLLAELELVETLCQQEISRRAAAAGLRVGPALVPGVADVPAAAQQALFECLGGTATGVTLTKVGAMNPLKSFSCFFVLQAGLSETADGLHLCEHCDLSSCAFRRRGRGAAEHTGPAGGRHGHSHDILQQVLLGPGGQPRPRPGSERGT